MYKLFEIITQNKIWLQADVIKDIVVLELKVGVVRAVVARFNRLNLPLIGVLVWWIAIVF